MGNYAFLSLVVDLLLYWFIRVRSKMLWLYKIQSICPTLNFGLIYVFLPFFNPTFFLLHGNLFFFPFYGASEGSKFQDHRSGCSLVVLFIGFWRSRCHRNLNTNTRNIFSRQTWVHNVTSGRLKGYFWREHRWYHSLLHLS